MSEWIKCIERMPADRQRVLIATVIGTVDVDIWISSQEPFWFESYGRSPLRKVTHWQPLPQPPKADHDHE